MPGDLIIKGQLANPGLPGKYLLNLCVLHDGTVYRVVNDVQ